MTAKMINIAIDARQEPKSTIAKAISRNWVSYTWIRELCTEPLR